MPAGQLHFLTMDKGYVYYYHPAAVAAGLPVYLFPAIGEVWCFVSIKFKFTASAAVADRFVRVDWYGPTGNPPVVIYHRSHFNDRLTANQTVEGWCSRGVTRDRVELIPTAGSAAYDFYMWDSLPENYLMGNTGGITSDFWVIDVANMQAADQISSVHAQILRFRQ
jgi:hypothetical protein